MFPCGDKVDQTAHAVLRVEPGGQFGTLGRDAPIAQALLAGAAQMAAKRHQRGRADIDCVRAKRDRFDDIGARTDTAARYDRHLVADTFIAQALVDSGERQLDGDPHIVTDARGRGAGAA